MIRERTVDLTHGRLEFLSGEHAIKLSGRPLAVLPIIEVSARQAVHPALARRWKDYHAHFHLIGASSSIVGGSGRRAPRAPHTVGFKIICPGPPAARSKRMVGVLESESAASGGTGSSSLAESSSSLGAGGPSECEWADG